MNANRGFLARTETGLLVVILAVVAVSAGWASFSHVHDWTMRHVPDGTPDAFGWVNAVISELVPVAAFLTIRRRLRTRQSIGYPLFLLIVSATFSLSAQLAVADPSPSGWLLSAVPALAFMALVKLVFTAVTTTPAPEPATARPEPDHKPTPEPTPVDQVDTVTPNPEPVRPEPVPVPEPTPAPAMVEPRPAVIAPTPALPPVVQVPPRPTPTVLVPSVVQSPARTNGHIVSGVIR
ncbi:hypothetical protein ACQSSU_03725 [Micromonospora echinospora]